MAKLKHPPLTITLHEIAAEMQTSYKTIHRMAQRGDIPTMCKRGGWFWRGDRATIIRWITSGNRG